MEVIAQPPRSGSFVFRPGASFPSGGVATPSSVLCGVAETSLRGTKVWLFALASLETNNWSKDSK